MLSIVENLVEQKRLRGIGLVEVRDHIRIVVLLGTCEYLKYLIVLAANMHILLEA